MNTPTKAQVCMLLDRWIRQRPGLDFGNYCSAWNDHDGRRAYFAEVRRIGRDLADARILLGAVERSSMTDETLFGAFGAYAGRLRLEEDAKKPGIWRLSYCTGQYWPTEYRRAACAVLAAALWDHYREGFAAHPKPGESAGHAIRRNFRFEFGRGIQSRWFN